MSFVDCLTLFEADAQTDAVILVGEIGGSAEDSIVARMTKPLVA